MNRRIKLGMMTLCLIGLGVQLSNCAPEPKYRTPALGEVVVIPPIAINEQPGQDVGKTPAVKLSVTWGGRAINAEQGNPILHFYDQNGELRHSMPWAALEKAHRRSGCSDSMVSSMDGYLMGVAMICDGSLDFSQIRSIKAVDSKGATREATSWGAYVLNEEVTVLSIGLY